jgi:hypothetical protein
MADSGVGRNKAIQARSARWRFRRAREVFAGKASAPRQLLLRCSTSCIHAVVLTPLTYIIHRDVVNADIAGANICPCRQRQFSLSLEPAYSGLRRDVYNDERAAWERSAGRATSRIRKTLAVLATQSWQDFSTIGKSAHSRPYDCENFL